MENKKLEQLQKMYDSGLINEEEFKMKREKIISEIIDEEKENTKPKKKHKIRKIILIAVGIFLGLGILGAIFDSDDDSTTTAKSTGEEINKESKSKAAQENATEFKKTGKWYPLDEIYEIKISSVEKKSYVKKDDVVIEPKDGTTYVAVNFSYRNKSNVPKKHLYFADFQDFYLISPDGKKYERDISSSMILFYETLDFLESLEFVFDGNADKGYLNPYSENYDEGKNIFAFEIPNDGLKQKGWKLVVNDMEFSISM